MLTTEVGTLVYNHIQHGIYIIIEFYPNFDIPGGDQTVDSKYIVYKKMTFDINYG